MLNNHNTLTIILLYKKPNNAPWNRLNELVLIVITVRNICFIIEYSIR
jgi:hypothetical protein